MQRNYKSKDVISSTENVWKELVDPSEIQQEAYLIFFFLVCIFPKQLT